MHIYEPQEYQNFLIKISLSTEEIKNLVATYKLTFYYERNREVEWGIKLPIFVDVFFAYEVDEHQSISNHKESFDYYIQYNKEFFDNLNRPDLELGIMTRTFRIYPSLVYENYFNKYIEERLGTKCQIIYNTRLDIEEGIDIMVITQKNNYGVCFFTNTRRAYIGGKSKEQQHTLFDNVKYVEMPMDFNGSIEAGVFFLYGEKEYN